VTLSLIALRRTAAISRVLAWVALITFAIGAIVARDLALLQSVGNISEAPSLEAQIVVPPSDKRIAKVRPSGISKRTAWSPTDPTDDDDETDEDSDTVAPSHARPGLPPPPFIVAPAIEQAKLARFVTSALTIPIARRHAPNVRGPPIAG
jgi:hypothetical protein